jgi:hypothetical protein
VKRGVSWRWAKVQIGAVALKEKREIMAFYSENGIKHINALCESNSMFQNVEPNGTYSNP